MSSPLHGVMAEAAGVSGSCDTPPTDWFNRATQTDDLITDALISLSHHTLSHGEDANHAEEDTKNSGITSEAGTSPQRNGHVQTSDAHQITDAEIQACGQTKDQLCDGAGAAPPGVNKERAYRRLVQRLPRSLRKSADGAICVPSAGTIGRSAVISSLPVARIQEYDVRAPSSIRRAHSMHSTAQFNNLRADYKKYCHYRLKEKDNQLPCLIDLGKEKSKAVEEVKDTGVTTSSKADEVDGKPCSDDLVLPSGTATQTERSERVPGGVGVESCVTSTLSCVNVLQPCSVVHNALPSSSLQQHGHKQRPLRKAGLQQPPSNCLQGYSVTGNSLTRDNKPQLNNQLQSLQSDIPASNPPVKNTKPVVTVKKDNKPQDKQTTPIKFYCQQSGDTFKNTPRRPVRRRVTFSGRDKVRYLAPRSVHVPIPPNALQLTENNLLAFDQYHQPRVATSEHCTGMSNYKKWILDWVSGSRNSQPHQKTIDTDSDSSLENVIDNKTTQTLQRNGICQE